MRKVVGIGETVYDIFFRCGTPVGATPGGSTYNSMVSLGRAGIHAEFISETGDDRIGRIITEFLEKNGVSSRCVCIHEGQKSALSLAFLNENSDAEYVFYKEHAKDRLEFEYPPVSPDDIILFGSFYAINPVVRRQVRSFLDYARAHGAILFYDVNFRDSHRSDIPDVLPAIRENMATADVVRGSAEDFEVLFAKNGIEEFYHSEISHLVDNFIYTRGSEPAELRATGNIQKRYPVTRVDVVSTVGAGDNFNAGIIYGFIRNGITKEMLREGLSISQWDSLFECAQEFSANVCKSIYNYVDVPFGETKKREMVNERPHQE